MKAKQYLVMLLFIVLIFSISVKGTNNTVSIPQVHQNDGSTDTTDTTHSDNETETTHSDNETSEPTETSDVDSSEVSSEQHESEKDKLDFKVKLEVSDQEATLKTEIDNGTNKEEFKGFISFSGSPEVKIEYKSEVNSSETKSELKVRVQGLVEFNDTNNNGIFDANDTTLQVYKFDDIGFGALQRSTRDLGAGFTEHIINATTTDGVFTMVFHISETFTQSNGVNLKPTSVKIDYIIDHFIYTSNTSLLALDTKVESTSKVEESEDSPDEQDHFATNEATVKTAGDNTAYFSWVKTAQVDGVTTDVGVSVYESSDNDQKLYFIYQHGDLIVHDPTVGVQASAVLYAINVDLGRISPPQLSSALSALPGTSMIATFVILLSTSLILRRRK